MSNGYTKFSTEKLEQKFLFWHRIWSGIWRICLTIAVIAHGLILVGCVSCSLLMAEGGYYSMPWAVFFELQLEWIRLDGVLFFIVFLGWVFAGELAVGPKEELERRRDYLDNTLNGIIREQPDLSKAITKMEKA